MREYSGNGWGWRREEEGRRREGRRKTGKSWVEGRRIVRMVGRMVERRVGRMEGEERREGCFFLF